MSAALVLIANILTVSEHGREKEADDDAELVAEAVEVLARASKQMIGWTTLRRLHAAFAELACRARVARARVLVDRPHGSSPLAWLEQEARRSASHSAVALVAAFTSAEEKPLTTRLGLTGNSLTRREQAGTI